MNCEMLMSESLGSSWHLQWLHSESFLCLHRYVNTKPNFLPKTPGRVEQQMPKPEESNLLLVVVHDATLSGTIYVKGLGILKEFKINFRWELLKLKFEVIASRGIVGTLGLQRSPRCCHGFGRTKHSIQGGKKRRKNLSSSVMSRPIKPVVRFIEKASGS